MVAKENANPQLFRVEEQRVSTRRTPLDWSQLGTFLPTMNNDDDTTNDDDMEDILVASAAVAILPTTKGGAAAANIVPTSASDKAILQALVDCYQATNGKGVHLLHQAGLDIPISIKSRKVAASGPIFQLAAPPTTGTATTTTSIPSDISLQGVVITPRNRLLQQKKRKMAVQQKDELTAAEIFDIIRNIEDPEHPHTLEQLGVVSLEQVELVTTTGSSSSSSSFMVNVRFTPTIPHCSMATLIGLCIRVKLWRSLTPGIFKVHVQIEPGTHVSEMAINKQLRDKERVCAALENKHLAGVVNKCIRNGMMTTES